MNKRADLSIDTIIKLIIIIVFLILAIVIISTVIFPEFTNQGERTKDLFNIF